MGASEETPHCFSEGSLKRRSAGPGGALQAGQLLTELSQLLPLPWLHKVLFMMRNASQIAAVLARPLILLV